MLRMVSGRKSPLRSDGPVAAARRPASRRAAAGCTGCAPRPSGSRWCRWCTRSRPVANGSTSAAKGASGAAASASAPLPSTVLEHHDPGRAPSCDLLGGRGVARSSDDAAVVEQVPLLRRRQRAVDPHPDRADAHRAVEREDHVEVVRQRACDPVARPHAQGVQRVRGATGEPVELRVRPAPGAGDQRLAPGVVGDDRREDLGDGAGDRDGWRRRHWPTARCCNSTIIGRRYPMYALVST